MAHLFYIWFLLVNSSVISNYFVYYIIGLIFFFVYLFLVIL